MTSKYKTIGILGGMGPAATSQLYNGIISIFQKKFNTKYDKDFPEIIIISLPIPDIVEKIENEKTMIYMLVDAAKRLEIAGSSFIVIPCNSVHAYINEIRKSVKIPVLSIMEEVTRIAFENGYTKLGLISTEYTIKKRLFEEKLNQKNIQTLKPNANEIKILTKIIMNILSGKKLKIDKNKLLKIIKKIEKRNVDQVILGCTEFPLLFDKRCKYIDTIDLLANAAVMYSTQNYLSKSPDKQQNDHSTAKRNS